MAGHPASRITIAALGALLLASCAAPLKPLESLFGRSAAPEPETPVVTDATAEPAYESDIESPIQAATAPDETAPEPDSWARLREGFRLNGGDNEALEQQLTWYGKNRRHLETVLNRSAPYLPYVLERAEAHQLPTEIALIPVIESGYRPRARSPRNAAGLWQFIPATGRAYDLHEDEWYDARGDVVASTDAALRLLVKLNERFDGDWLHTLAAYNCGARRVERAILSNRTQGQNTDFWSLDLPKTTRAYVPRLLALARIVATPDRYGISLPEIDNHGGFARIPIKQQLSLTTAAEIGALDADTLWALNGGLKQRVTPPYRYDLIVPSESAARIRHELDKLPEQEWVRWSEHSVHEGENLWLIARQHGISVATLKRINGLQSDLVKPGQRLLLPTGATAATAQHELRRPGEQHSRVAVTSDSLVQHQVQQGDSLWLIARRYGVSVADLKRWNDLSGQRHLHPGQLINISRSSAEEI
jgi:membrane-bound lytic murein transglycosylase D